VIAYLDASVLLRIVLREANPLAEWDEIEVGITSDLTRVEAARVIDRLTVLRVLQDEEIAEKYAEVADILQRVDFIELNADVLARASEELPTVLAPLDAIHLASASLYRDAQPDDEPPIVLATHDRALANAARALRFRVIGA
jgi:predicted nucleic acid-binding protein